MASIAKAGAQLQCAGVDADEPRGCLAESNQADSPVAPSPRKQGPRRFCAPAANLEKNLGPRFREENEGTERAIQLTSAHALDGEVAQFFELLHGHVQHQDEQKDLERSVELHRQIHVQSGGPELPLADAAQGLAAAQASEVEGARGALGEREARPT